MADIPTADEIRAIVTEVVAPLREELARLRRQEEKEAVSIAEAAERLHVSERTVKRGIADGSIPSVKVRGRTLVRLAALLPSNDQVVRLAHKARKT